MKLGAVIYRLNGNILRVGDKYLPDANCICGRQLKHYASKKCQRCAMLGVKRPYKPRPKTWGRLAWNKGRKCPEYSGERHGRWNGGTKIRKALRESFEYRNWRQAVFERDGWSCCDCGKHGGDLEVHHIKSFLAIILDNQIKSLDSAVSCQELWDTNNGLTVCYSCHKGRDKQRR